MAEQDNGLFAIEVDADDYAGTAASDTPVMSRTYQSQEAFNSIKASYTANIDGGDTKIKLRKKEVQLLGYAAGEMYFERDYENLTALCERALDLCELDVKVIDSVQRWRERCLERMLQASSG
ncbi:hypothetical protein LTR37_010536 [Vermiconidia calcicola]|uniref:Uncharacterized protein n=1 Tax=Vermiconidia calcicola TaxID=1690605 RepID=A0ACC3N4W8_9PEZI|nr:hypothetical protein LTR37_010536 [Vermiconidia calcicola]